MDISASAASMRAVAFLIEGVMVVDEFAGEDGDLLWYSENDGVLGFTQNIFISTKDDRLV